jgi:hypothetical protein
MATAPTSPISTRTILLAIAAFSICSFAAAARSKGFLESDGAMHYMMARHAIDEPAYFVDFWGRPLFTCLYAIPAKYFGLLGARVLSLVIAIGVGLVAMRLAAGQGMRWPVLALIFTLGQPMLFLHSFSELTELPFALVIGLALLAYQSERFGVMAILCALAPLGRPEGFAFLFLAAIALVAHRHWLWLLVLPIFLIAWSIAGHFLSGPIEVPWWRWLIDHWPYESRSEYSSGSIFQFLAVLPAIVGPFVFPAMWIGIARRLHLPSRDTVSRSRWLTAVLPLGILILHSLIYRFGRLSSSGAPRYLLITAPMWGVLCADGWEWIFTRFHWPRPLSWAALAVVLPGCVNFAYRVLPLQSNGSWIVANEIVDWTRTTPLRKDYPRLLANHPGIFYYLDVSPIDTRFVQPWSRDAVEHPQPGMILLWDPEYCLHNASAEYVVPLQTALDAGWIDQPNLDAVFRLSSDPSNQWHILLSPSATR